MDHIITSSDEAIDALGGPRAVGKELGVAERAVWNWRERGFPAHRYPQIRALLRRKRLKFTLDAFARMGNGR